MIGFIMTRIFHVDNVLVFMYLCMSVLMCVHACVYICLCMWYYDAYNLALNIVFMNKV